MHQLSNYQLTSDPRPQEQLPSLAHYTVIKMALNGDYIARDRLDEKYLICSGTSFQPQHSLNSLHIIQCSQSIQEDSGYFGAFPMPEKLTWAGDTTALKYKSELFCLTLLYSALKYIAKPLIESGSSLPSADKYLIIENLWIKDSSCYLLLCRRWKDKTIKKVEPQNKNNLNPTAINYQLGLLFWQMFCTEEDGIPQKSTLKQIVKAMIKKQLNLSQLIDIMESKTAKRKFISQNNYHEATSVRSKAYSNIDKGFSKQTIQYDSVGSRYDSIGSQFDSLPVGPGRRTLFVKKPNNKSLGTWKDKSPLNLSGSDCPPSFSKTRRGKRHSLFVHPNPSKGPRYDTTSRGQSQTIDISGWLNHSKRSNSKEQTSQLYYRSITHNKTKDRERRQLRTLFEDVKNRSQSHNNTIERLTSQSKEKALATFKRNIQATQNQDSKIDDSHFQALQKQKQHHHKKNVKQIMSQASKILNRGDKEINLQLSQQHLQLNASKVASATLSKESPQIYSLTRQTKIYNQGMMTDQNKITQYQLEQPKEKVYFTSDQSHPGLKKIQGTKSNLFGKEVIKNIPDDLTKLKAKQSVEDEEFSLQLLEIQKKPKQPTDLKQNQREIVQNETKIENNNKQDTKPKEPSPQLQIKQKQAVKQPIPKDRIKGQRQNKNSYSFIEQAKNQNILQTLPQCQLIDKKVKEQNVKVPPPKVQLQKPLQPPKKPTVIKNILASEAFDDDELQQIQLVTQFKPTPTPAIQTKPNPYNPSSKSIPSPTIPAVRKNEQLPSKQQLTPAQSSKQLNKKQQVNPRKNSTEKEKGRQRLKSVQSNTSSTSGKAVRKQIDQYVFMINKMGEAVAKTSKLSKKLQNVDWYVGVYFLYKRFFYQRKKIEKYLLDQSPRLTRYEQIGLAEWKEWLAKGQRDSLLNKIQEDNKNIQVSLKKMFKKTEAMAIPASIALNIGITKNIEQSSIIAIECIANEYDQLVHKKLLDDPELFTHICQMINALYVMSELDGKLQTKKSVLEYANIKRTPDQLKKLVNTILNFYFEED